MRTRFAPSPTGFLHLGHALSAHLGQRRAEMMGGEWILRIEDIDYHRCQPHFAEAIFEDLQWLGLKWPEPVLYQSTKLSRYYGAINTLINRGLTVTEPALNHPYEKISLNLIACRKALGSSIEKLGYYESGPDSLNKNGYFVPLDWSLITDTTIARRDIGLSYALCVTIDDAEQNITEVLRGQDLSSATHFHVLIQALLDLPTPSYHHHPLIKDEFGQKLAKKRGSRSIRDARADGYSAHDLIESAYRFIDLSF